MLKSRPTRAVPVAPSVIALRSRARTLDELLLDVGRGDHQAFTTLYDRIGRLVYANVRRVLQDASRSDAVAEDAFIEVWRHAGGFDPAELPALSWILDLAHQLATERVRQDLRYLTPPSLTR